jgi:hypothetical protein
MRGKVTYRYRPTTVVDLLRMVSSPIVMGDKRLVIGRLNVQDTYISAWVGSDLKAFRHHRSLVLSEKRYMIIIPPIETIH